MPFKHSNMPSFMFYSIAVAEILRIARASTDCVIFSSASCIVIQRMIKQGACVESVLGKMCRIHVEDYDHLVHSGKELVSILFT